MHALTLRALLSDGDSDQDKMFVSQDSNSSQVHNGLQQQEKHNHPSSNGKMVRN